MGVAEIIGFAVCWLIVASLMLWGVFTEHKRGGPAPPATDSGEWHPSRFNRVSPTDWIVVESTEGSAPEVGVQARLIASAWLASRGLDIETLPPSDLRTEVTTSDDGMSTTRVLVRAGALNASRRHR